MKNYLAVVAVLIFINLVMPLFAEQTAYITDSLRLRVYASPDESSKVLETIDSGDSIELVESQGAFSKVRIYDGTVGWIKSAFIVEEPPAKLLYYSVSEQNKELKQQIKALNNNGSEENGRNEELEQALAEQQQLNQQLQEQLSTKVQDNFEQNSSESKQTITTTLATHNYSEKTLWLLGLATALAILGFLFGIKMSSLRMRKRLHGFRLE